MDTTKQESGALAVAAPRQQIVHSFDDMERMAQVLAQSGLFGVKNPTQALALMLVAQAEGEHPASVAQDYDIIQGKGSRKTHSVLARFQAMGGKVEWHELTHVRADATFTHPKGGSLRLDWTIEQAKTAGLVGRDNWKGYARAMLRARCIAEGVRAVYPAAIGGWQVPEEAMGPQLDAQPTGEKHMEAAGVVSTPAPQSYDQTHFDANFPKWSDVIAKGRKSPADLIVFIEAKGNPLTEEQKARILSVKRAAADVQDVQPKAKAPTFAEVADRINAAETHVELDALDETIGAVVDAQQRAELVASVERRREAIPAFD